MISPESKAQIEDIGAQIQTLLGKMEELGEEGKVDEAQGLMRIIDKLKADKETLLRGGIVGVAGNGAAAGIGQEKKMRVCETCGAFLVVGDTEKRMSSHLEGKQHQGYAKIRQAIEDYHKRKGDEGMARRRSTGANAVERGGDRDHRDNYHPYKRDNRDNRDRGDRDRDGDRHRERDRYDRGGGRDHRDRERDRDNRDNRDKRDYNRGGGYRDDRKRRDDDR